MSKIKKQSKIKGQSSKDSIDILGILVLSISLLILTSLFLGDTGIVGSSIKWLLEILFGEATWIAPVLLVFYSYTLLTRWKKRSNSKSQYGILCIFISILGYLGASSGSTILDINSIPKEGGYTGAIVGWVFVQLLGKAAPLGFLTLALVGCVLCLDRPLYEIWLQLRERLQNYKQKEYDTNESYAKNSRLALDSNSSSNMQGKLESSNSFNIKQAVIERVTKPTIKDINTPVLISDTPIPKEGYTLPPLTLLVEPKEKYVRTKEEVERNIKTLEGTLEQFKIDANVVEIANGPTITRYEIQLGPGIRVSRITALADNIAMSMAASHVRVEAPIPGKSAIGVEVPNDRPSAVTLRELCESEEFVNSDSRLLFTVGKDVSGINRYADLTKMPHLLIGGATNSGKSIGLASIITSLLLRNTPKDLKFVMIDPKRVELSLFDGIPHLMHPVVKNVKEAPGVLRAVWREMDMRYEKLSEAGVRNIDSWNEKASFQDRMSYIVVVIDELADLMMQSAAEVESSICRLAQLARATGIHLVIATQRPSVDVITGTIKANIASRMAFSVSSQIDSRTILDSAGAERLIGRGDMLFYPIGASKATRIQGCYVSEKEIEEVCKHWVSQEQPQYILNPIQVAMEQKEAEMQNQEMDPLWEEVVKWIVEKGQASTSMIQRRFSIGFQRASRLLDTMEEQGIVGPREGSKPRDVLKNILDIEMMFSNKAGSVLMPSSYTRDSSDDDIRELSDTLSQP